MSENLTTYSISGSHITNTSATKVDFAGLLANEAAFSYFDFGAAHFTGTGYAEGTLTITTAATNGRVGITFSDTLAVYPGVSNDVGLSVLATSSLAFSAYSWLTSGGANGAVVAGAGLSLNTAYYYRAGYYSAIGQYGGTIIEIYSDAGMTTLVANGCAFATAAQSFRYFMAAGSVNTSTNAALTGSNQNVTITTGVSAGIDLTTFTTSGTNIANVANSTYVTTLTNNQTSYSYKDYGASYFSSNFELTEALAIKTLTGAATQTACCILGLVNTLGDGNNTNDFQGVKVLWASSTTYNLYAREENGATEYLSGASTTLSTNKAYWVKLLRDTTVGTYGTLYVKIYADKACTVQVGSTISVTLHASVSFRYLNTIQSWNNGQAARNVTGAVGGLSVATQFVNAAKGAFSWAGKTSPLSSQSISTTLGAFGWAGKASSLSTMLNITKGTFAWAGKASNINTGGQVNTTPGAFGWAGKSSSLSHSISAAKGTFSWAGKTSILGASVTSLRSWRITKWDATTGKVIPVTGLTTVKYYLYNPSTGKTMDLSDGTFKAYSSCVTPKGTMVERDAVNYPGWYDYLLATTGLSGLYQENSESYSTDNYFSQSAVRFQDGVEYLGGLTLTENTQLMITPSAAQVLALY